MFPRLFPTLFAGLLASAAICAADGPAAAPSPVAGDFEMIVSRHRDGLLKSIAQRTPANVNLNSNALTTSNAADAIAGYVRTLRTDGTWEDVDYADQSPGVWKTAAHLLRTLAMTRAYVAAGSPLHDDPAVLRAIEAALDHWTARRYQNPNWWHNDIGIPLAARDIIILLGPQLTGEHRRNALDLLNQYGRPHAGGGANTTWEAGLQLFYGALTHDAALVDAAVRIFLAEVRVNEGAEGIQDDGSFHAHGARLQQFHYGGSFLNDSAELGWELRGTPWAFPAEKGRVLADYVLRGCQWMCRGTSTVPGTLDRSVGRPGALRNADLRHAVRQFMETYPAEADRLTPVLTRQEGRGAPLTGYRAFPDSDFSTCQRPGFAFFLKTISERTEPTQVGGNGDNLRGWLLNAGDHYLVRDGLEYFNLMPVWDWDLLPGVTHAVDAGHRIVRRPFVGAVSDGVGGATAMDGAFADADNDEAPTLLSVKKLWASDGDVTVCLIGGVQKAADVHAPVRTALDQCLRRGPVTVGSRDGQENILADGERTMEGVRWVHHAGFAYLPLDAKGAASAGATLTFRVGPATGSWQSVHSGSAATPVTMPVFLPILEQEPRAGEPGPAGYVLAACDTPQAADLLSRHPTWHLLAGDATVVQVVRFDDGLTTGAFRQPGSVSDGVNEITVDRPCLFLLRGGSELRLSDPIHQGGAVHVQVNGKGYAVDMPASGDSSAAVKCVAD